MKYAHRTTMVEQAIGESPLDGLVAVDDHAMAAAEQFCTFISS